MIGRLIGEPAGATAIEYALIAALIAVAALFAVQGAGSSLQNMFNVVAGTVDAAIAATGG